MSKRAFAPVLKASCSLSTIVFIVLLAMTLCTCTSPEQALKAQPSPDAFATTRWSELWEQTPYSYSTPLPPAQATVVDGTYVQIEPTQSAAGGRSATPTPPGGGAWMWHSVRPTVWVMPPGPYSVHGGRWTLSLDHGIFRIGHEPTGWHTLGSYSVSGNRIEFFNDPHCLKAVGRYEWTLTMGQLILELVEDDCGGQAPFLSGRKARAVVFSGRAWASR